VKSKMSIYEYAKSFEPFDLEIFMRNDIQK
jgi:hypothetical protein